MKKKVLVGLILLVCIFISACGQTAGDAATSTEATTADVTTTDTTKATTDETTKTEQPTEHATASLDGKKVIFIGNSFIYYGGVVTNGSPRANDTGWFYQIAKANGENVTVTDCTYGGHRLYDFTTAGCKTGGGCGGTGTDLLQGLNLYSYDYVFMSEAGENNSNILTDVQNIMSRFTNPDTRFFYLCHTYSYTKNHSNITGNLKNLQNLGVSVVDWGHVCYDVYAGSAKIEGSVIKYAKNTFVNNVDGDTFHPNPLAGYVQALTAYCAATSKTAVGQKYDAKTSIKYGSGSVTYANYASKYYSGDQTTNFAEVFDSETDMLGLQKFIDSYLNKWGLGVGTQPPALRDKCDHTFDAGKVTIEPTELMPGLRVYTCTKCGATKEETIAKLDGTKTNLAAGKSATMFGGNNSTIGNGSILTDGSIGNNNAGKLDGKFTSSGEKDEYGGKGPSTDTKKVTLSGEGGASYDYYYVIKVDLGEAKTVNGVCIYAQGYKKTVLDSGADVLVSKDGTTWTRVYSSTTLLSGPKDGQGWENYVDDVSSAADESAPAYLSVTFDEISDVRYVIYGCTGVRAINGYYTTRFTEFEVYGN